MRAGPADANHSTDTHAAAAFTYVIHVTEVYALGRDGLGPRAVPLPINGASGSCGLCQTGVQRASTEIPGPDACPSAQAFGGNSGEL